MTRCITATKAKKKTPENGLDREPVVSQLQPELGCPSLSPASFALPASTIFGTHACVGTLQVSSALHCASVLHATHLPLGTSHTSEAPASVPASLPPPQSASAVHARHVCVDASQIGLLASVQSLFPTHATHVYVASSQTAVAPVHAFAYFDVHVTHWPSFVPPSAHAFVHACPLSNELHGLHAGGTSTPSQIGICATHVCA
jgi:uncharacterized iron-regulated membrane protein